MISPWKIILIVALILLIFGGKKLPELGKQLGSAIFSFRKSIKDGSSEETADKKATETDENNDKKA